MLSLRGSFLKSLIRIAPASINYTRTISHRAVAKMIILPKVLMNGFPVMPRITHGDCDMKDSKFVWFRQINSNGCKKDTNFIELAESFIYTPTEEDIGHCLRLVYYPSDGKKKGRKYMMDTKQPVQLSPSYFPFEERHKHTQKFLESNRDVRFISYNILADLYANSDYSRNVLFNYCPTHALSFDYRSHLIMKELIGYHANIICLQEVDRKFFDNTLGPYLKLKNNYQGVFHRKGGHVSEGLATFYLDESFELVEDHKTLLRHLIRHPKIFATGGDSEVEGDLRALEKHPILSNHESLICKKLLSKFDNIREAISSNAALESRFCERTTILQTCLLKSKKDPNCYVLVANTHLYSMPDADHIRLLQGSTSVKYLEFLIEEFYLQYAQDSTSGANLYLIFCGDMNSTPDCGLFQLVTKGRVGPELVDWKSNEEEAVQGLAVDTRLRLSPAYENIEYTNYTPNFHGLLDYIYYEREKVKVNQVVPLPYHEDVVMTGGIPSDVFPSDHLALVADLTLT